MPTTLQVVNVKCGGCQKHIASSLEKEGFKDVDVDLDAQSVTFEGDVEAAKKLLSRLGYPEASSDEAKSLLKKAKSFVSCAIGRMK